MKKTKLVKDILSIGVVHPLKMLRESKCIAVGTGFFYSHNEELFFITAGHNFTGKDPETDEIFGIPERISIFLYNIENGMLAGWKEHEVYLTDSQGAPMWLEHPEYNTKVDVVAIKVDLNESNALRPINRIKLDEDVPIDVGMDVFILGYPHGYVPYPTITPIWKRGSLATEYAIDIGRKPKFYVDSATAKGMSGSPIIAQQYGYYPEGKEENLGDYVFGRGRRFIGIYTGRYTDKETADLRSDIFNAQLGIGWKESIIKEIVEPLKIMSEAEI